MTFPFCKEIPQGFVLLKTYDMRSTRLVLIHGTQLQISVEMTNLIKKTQFHVALFIALIFLDIFFFKTHGVDDLWYFAAERKCHRTKMQGNKYLYTCMST